MKSDKKWRWLAILLGFIVQFCVREWALVNGLNPWLAEVSAIVTALAAMVLVTYWRTSRSRAKLQTDGQPIEYLFRPFEALSEAIGIFLSMVGGIFLAHQLIVGSQFDEIHYVGLSAVIALWITLDTTAYEKFGD